MIGADACRARRNGDRGWHIGQNPVSAGMGLGTLEYDLLGHLAYWVQTLGLGAILGSFAGFIDLARMKLRYWTGIGTFFLGSVENAASRAKLPLRFDSPSYDSSELRIEACRIRPTTEQALFPFYAPA